MVYFIPRLHLSEGLYFYYGYVIINTMSATDVHAREIPPSSWLSPEAEAQLDEEFARGYETQRQLAEVRNERDQLRQEVMFDSMTGLLAKSEWKNRLVAKLEQASINETTDPPSPHAIGVIFIDLDRFKKANDELGHEKGDELIKEISEVIRSALRGTTSKESKDDNKQGEDDIDLLAHERLIQSAAEHDAGRYGGDEFAVLCDLLSHSDKIDLPIEEKQLRIQIIVDRLRKAFMEYLAAQSAEVQAIGMDIAIGFSIWKPGVSATQLLKEADDKMFVDKQSRKTQEFTEDELREMRAVAHLFKRAGVRVDFLDEK